MGKILVVDDDQTVANSVACSLVSLGHVVRVAYSGPQALQRAQDFAFDAAILELCMREMSGAQLLEQLMRMRPASKFVLMTARNSPAPHVEAIAPGAQALLHKPIALSALQRCLPLLRPLPLSAADPTPLGPPWALRPSSGQPRARACQVAGASIHTTAIDRLCVTFKGVPADAEIVRYARRQMAALTLCDGSWLHVLITREPAYSSDDSVARLHLRALEQRVAVTARAERPLLALRDAFERLQVATLHPERSRCLH